MRIVKRGTVPSRSGPQSGEPKFEKKVEGKGNIGTFDPSSTRAMRTGGEQQTKTKPEKLVNGKNSTHVRTGHGLSQNGYVQFDPGFHGMTINEIPF